VSRCQHAARSVVARYGEVQLFRCDYCKLIFSDRYPDGFDPRSLYSTYYKNEIAGGRFRFGIERLIRGLRLWRALKVATIAPAARSILDIGCGRGLMLHYLRRVFGYRRAVGTQIAENMYRYARDVLGLEVYDRDLLELQLASGSFDIVSIWHVLEHVPDPDGYIERCADLLRPGGRLVIEVPNYASWSRRLTGRHWLGLDLDYHLAFFTPQSLIALVRRHSFRVDRVNTFSMEYSTFISAQSIASRITGTDQSVFNWLQGGVLRPRECYQPLLLALLLPLALLVNLVLYPTRWGEVLLVVAVKPAAGGAG
jgi:2-polyprenyl-3-methyl-5-hydroxy-6-metoxy-1,4-benzoquinol methylase